MKTLRSSNNENDISLFWRLYSYLAITPMYDTIYIIGLIIFESILCYIIIEKVSYTEIDWKAYMEEVEMWYIDGEYDYRKIRGGTGPLVYPAGFLYLFWWFRYMTNNGTNIRVAQYIFYVLYLLTQLAVCWIYQCTVTFLRQRHHASQPEEQQSKLSSSWQFCHQIWSWRVAMLILCLSKRMHSIFVLRLFNDGPTMLLLYVSILLFIHNKWNWGCIVFSFAVSIKMNVLLFAPGLLLLLLQIGPNLMTVVMRLLFCCAVPQLILGAPFLLSHPISYLRKAFELDRVFFYEWTVNLKFLPESIFVSKNVSLLLLSLHIGGLVYFCMKWLHCCQKLTGKRIFINQQLTAPYITATMFVSNFIGICFARTLHYQFYCWYFHAIPYLIWYTTSIVGVTSTKDSIWYHPMLRLSILFTIEMSFLTFPATSYSSFLLQMAHYAILIQIQPPPPCTIVSTPDVATVQTPLYSNKSKQS